IARSISRDVKFAAIHLHEHQLLSLENILVCVGFSESTFRRILKLRRETGDIVSISNHIRGRHRILQCDDILYLICLVRHCLEWFLDELLVLLDTNRFVSVHYATIHRELEPVGVSLKKLKRIAKERNE
ncbi:hypothetical protein M405DRAFT_691548, partial [Rhizopogon salebrosus TDB-379]